MKKRTLLKSIVTLTLSLSIVLACFGCSNRKSKGGLDDDFFKDLECSETFTGAVSEESFENQEEAISSFLENEVSSDFRTAEIKKSTEKATLNEAQIDALSLTEEDKEGIVSVKKYEIEYSYVDSYTLPYSATLFANSYSNTVIIVYIISYGDRFKYLVPVPVVGDTITKAYHDSIFNRDNYRNCTMVYSVEEYSKSKEDTYTYELNALLLYNVNKHYEKINYKNTSKNFKEENYSEEEEWYFEQTPSGIISKLKEDGVWKTANETHTRDFDFDDFSLLDEFADMDYSYFTKTATGCKIEKENYIKIIKQLNGGDALGCDQLDITFDIFVVNGKVSGINVDIGGTIKDELGTRTGKITQRLLVKDFGTTVINTPN